MKLHRFFGIAGFALMPGLLFAADNELPTIAKAGQPSATVSLPGVQLAASNAGSTASIKLGGQVASSIPTLPSSTSTSSATFASLSAEAPITKGSTSRSLVSTNGWGNATVLGLSLLQFRSSWQAGDDVAFESYCRQMRAAAYQKMTKNGQTAAEAKKTSDNLDCSALNVHEYLPDVYPKWRSSKAGPAPGGTLAGLELKYGYSDSTFYSADFTKQKTRNKPWSTGIVLGWVPASQDSTLFLVKAERKNEYNDNDAVVRCPQNNLGSVDCVNGSFGAPQRTLGTVLSFETRALIGSSAAVSLSVSRNLKKRSTTVELPLFWLGDGSGALNGGVKAVWDTQEKSMVLAVFVGAPFNLWPL